MSETTDTTPETKVAPAKTPSPATVTASVTADDLIDPLIGSMPDVTPGAVSDEASFSSPGPEKVKDRTGNEFNPAKHRVDEKGKPRINRRGDFVHIDQGRPKKEQPAQSSGQTTQANAELLDDGETAQFGPKVDPYQTVASGYLDTASGFLGGALGGEAMLDEAEKEMLLGPTTQVVKMYKAKDIDPRLILASLSFGIMAGKLQKPSVRERWDMWKGKILGYFGKKQKA